MSFKERLTTVRVAEIALVFISAAFAYLLSFQIPYYPVFNESDHLIFLYEGWRMFNGDVIYKDFFEFTFPGTQVYYYLLLNLFGTVYWIAPATVVLIATVSCWLLLQVARVIVPEPLHLIPAMIFIFLGFRWFGLDPSHRMISPIFAVGAVFVLLKGSDFRHILGAGALCAATSFFTQQRGVALVFALATYLFITAKSSGQTFSEASRRPLLLFAVFAVCLGLVCLPFVTAAGPALFLESTVEYPALYYSKAPSNDLGVFLLDLSKMLADDSISGRFALLPTFFFSLLLPVTAIGIAAYVLLQRKKWLETPEVLLISVVTLFLLLSTAAPSPARLFQVSMPMLVLVSWLGAALIKSRGVRKFVTVGLTLALISLAGVQAVRFQTHWDFIHWQTPSGTLAVIPSEQFSRFLQIAEKVGPGESFFDVLQPFVYFPLQLKNPTRYGQIWPYGYTRPEHVADVIADLQADPPTHILWRNDYNKEPGERNQGDNTAPLADFVISHYEPVGDIYRVEGIPVQVWKRKPQS